MKKLTGEMLKSELWDTLLKLKQKKISPTVANAISNQSREILNIVKVEMAVARSNNEKLPQVLSGK